MAFSPALDAARDAATVRRVFAEPYEKDGLTVIAAALVSGAAGGGSGTNDKGQPGEGGGFGVYARPVGAYVIHDGTVRWRPAIDANRIIAVMGLVAIVCLLKRSRTSCAE
ncbi:MAG: hypothetical protein WCF36_17885 [Candidatus Nanopelagicales bacterium]